MRMRRWTHHWTSANGPRLPAALATLLALPVVACGGGGDGGGDGMTPPQNSSPSASIDGPEDEANFDEGVTITFQASASDPEDGDLTGASVVWESDEDGEIGTGTSVDAADLTLGHHIITLTATDSEGAMATDRIGVRVRPEGESITVELTVGDNFFEDLQGRTNENAFVRIRLNDTVRWTYGGGEGHTVDSGEGSGGDDGDGVPAGASSSMSGSLPQGGGTYEFTPDAEGTWTYYCAIHPSIMINSVIEVEPAP